MQRISADLWETRTFSPFPGLTTHAYLWTPAHGRNVLFYAPGSADDFDDIERLGGVAHQYLSHQDEAGPALGLVAERFGAQLHVPAAETATISKYRAPHVLLDRRHVDPNAVEVIPTPGHSPGSTSYVVHGTDGTYLFTGDTLFVGRDGRWTAGYIQGISEREALAASLELLATIEPDLILSSAFTGDAAAHRVSSESWRASVSEALASLRPTD